MDRFTLYLDVALKVLVALLLVGQVVAHVLLRRALVLGLRRHGTLASFLQEKADIVCSRA